jgi:hypothetical protein
MLQAPGVDAACQSRMIAKNFFDAIRATGGNRRLPGIVFATTVSALVMSGCPVAAEDDGDTVPFDQNCPSINPDNYALNENGKANLDLAIGNLEQIATREISVSHKVTIKVRKEHNITNTVEKEITIKLPEIIELIKTNRDGKRILAVKGLIKGVTVKDHSTHADKTVPPYYEGKADGRTEAKGRGPHAAACLKGTVLLAFPAGEVDTKHLERYKRYCPEGYILIDERWINEKKISLKTPGDYVAKAMLASLLVHEKTHELFLSRVTKEAEGLGVKEDNPEWSKAREQAISEEAHLKVYDLQSQVVEAEKQSMDSYKYPSESGVQPADKENGKTKLDQLLDELKSRAGKGGSSAGGSDALLQNDLSLGDFHCPPPGSGTAGGGRTDKHPKKAVTNSGTSAGKSQTPDLIGIGVGLGLGLGLGRHGGDHDLSGRGGGN